MYLDGLVLEKCIPGRFIVPEWTWPGRGTVCLIPGLSRAIQDIWSPYLICARVDYRNAVYIGPSSTNAYKLQSVVNAAAHLI